ncbi:TIGR02680 family protein [Natronosporangium hydrolyticum]|uniref:TIGR02680 family protein n=1 Tax=Natronosporangium hydrolyticum TaxID=2811111 RepID=A0A895YFF0_9ACTN|nr:TIGR02680 family protein [Natronosporangium hydrolyticum]QSB16594.1 TIGR02680 family protein [Natronosporangium hydrolyticum]
MTDPADVGRFRPTRAGIINLWDYRDEEFLFVDGWLVLRGPNGSGKTKALEVLFPFVLDGRIEPRRLNPFASEERTMKSNLLYRGQEVSHAYVWLEFGDGKRYVTVGIGLRAHRHVDRVSRWHFVTDGRVGVDFSLLDADDRPLNRKQLLAELGDEAVRDSPEEHRHQIDARLFGLGPARYEQLLDLVLTLRRPQLAKDLNPAELSRTLQRGLRPVDEHLLVEAAHSFDDMEAVARTLEGLVAADTATTGFLSIYSTYLRTHARAAADATTARRAAVSRQHEAVAQARAESASAADDEQAAAQRLAAAESEPARLRAHLSSLQNSPAYQSQQDLADLQQHVADLAVAAQRAQATVVGERAAEQARGRERQQAAIAARDAAAAVQRGSDALAGEAELAGIDWPADDAVPDGLAARVTARVSARRVDIATVREAAQRSAQAERDHARARDDRSAADEAVATAEAEVGQRQATLANARGAAVAEVQRWRHGHADLLAELSVPDLPEVLAEAAGAAGEPGEAPSLREIFSDATAAAVAARRDRSAALSAQRDTLDRQRVELATERERIAAEHDDAPPTPPTRRSARESQPGAPLWRLVRFADQVADRDAAGVEAALHAAGLLDAWVHPDPDSAARAVADGEQDGHLAPLPAARRPAGDTLADLLVPEVQQQVPAERVAAVLASIALVDLPISVAAADAPVAAVGRGGHYRHGVSAGRFAKPTAEYIGATARAARRAARIAECDRGLAALDAQITAVAAAAQAIDELLASVGVAAAALPSLQPVHAAQRELDRAAATLAARHDAAAAASTRLDQALAERSTAAAVQQRVTAERSLPADRVDEVAAAVSRFERGGVQLEGAHRHAAGALDAEQAAQERHDEAAQRVADAESAAAEAAQRHQEKDAGYQALWEAVGAEAEQVLAEADRVAAEITVAEAELTGARAAHSQAGRRRAAAEARVELGDEALAGAVAEAQQEALRLRPYAQPDLLGLLRCPTELRWPAEVGVAEEDELPEAVVALHEAILAATRELNPTETSLKQSATRLTTALAELQAQLPATGLDHRPEWTTDEGVIVVRVADEQGLTPVAHFAERIARERRDQEQLLTDAEQKVLEDALLGQLARQIHQRTIEARDLVEAMDTQMRARRMSSGITVGVGWRLADDLTTEQREVCKLLERDPARLGPAQLTSLRRHFASRIKTARAESPELPYRELLGRVLDYRQWRVFAFTLHRPGGGAEALTRARHSQLSGGEQSVSLHLPLFAAANALFGSARPEAPRLLGMDEAFAGVDETGRGELMSLARQFDLDLFMTGFDLWATHQSVRGAAHYDLSHSAAEQAVAAVLLVWDGTANLADFDGSLAQAYGSPGTRRSPAVGYPAVDAPGGAAAGDALLPYPEVA